MQFMSVCSRIFTVIAIIHAFSLDNCFAQGNKLSNVASGSQRNPFESRFNIQKKEEDKRREEATKLEAQNAKPLFKTSELKLTGILQGRRNLAIINGEIVGEGDIIEGKKIARIDKRSVIIKGEEDAKDIVLELKDDF